MPGCGLGEKTPVRFGWREEENPLKSMGNGGFFVRSNLLQCVWLIRGFNNCQRRAYKLNFSEFYFYKFNMCQTIIRITEKSHSF